MSVPSNREGALSGFELTEDWLVGNERIDREHAALMRSLHRMKTHAEENKIEDFLGERSSFLRDLADHFRHEEEIMARHGFAGAARHRQTHDALWRQLADYDPDRSDMTPSEFVQFGLEIFVRKILLDDLAFRDFMADRGEDIT